MSCQSGTSPIDISMKNVRGKCDTKCAFSFKYPASNCVATNQGNYISLSYENGSPNDVVYNNQKYNVDKIRLYFPSIHTFGGKKMPGEFIISHTPSFGGNQLLVCIPIKPSQNTTPASELLTKIIVQTSVKAPNEGETAQVLTDFSLSKIMPKKPYFSYTATLPYEPCNGTVEFVVFNPMDGAFDLSPALIKKATSFIKPNMFTTKTGISLFLNEKGPNLGSDNEIYIDCGSVGDGGADTEGATSSSSGSESSDTSASMEEFFKSTAGIILLSTIGGLALLFGSYKLYNNYEGDSKDKEKDSQSQSGGHSTKRKKH